MSTRLPERIDPWRSADLAKSFSGRLAVSGLPRLAAALAAPDGEVRYELAFHRDAKRRVVISGAVSATLSLRCQRCLALMPVPIHAEVQAAVVESDNEAANLPEAYDPVVATEDALSLRELIEDELLLALPDVPRHTDGECAAAAQDEPTAGPQRPNPFAVLAALKEKDENT